MGSIEIKNDWLSSVPGDIIYIERYYLSDALQVSIDDLYSTQRHKDHLNFVHNECAIILAKVIEPIDQQIATSMQAHEHIQTIFFYVITTSMQRGWVWTTNYIT